jgi:hypothetical protein
MLFLQAIPAMLLALVLCFDYRKSRDPMNLLDLHSSKGHRYIWYALPGYAIGLVTALAAGVLTHSPQPALLYLVLLLAMYLFVEYYSWNIHAFCMPDCVAFFFMSQEIKYRAKNFLIFCTCNIPLVSFFACPISICIFDVPGFDIFLVV